MTHAVASSKDRHLAEHERFAKERDRGEPAWVDRLRRSALARFSELDFPTDQDEEWRFTPLDPLPEIPFVLSRDGAAFKSVEDIPVFGARTSGTRRVFVNGRYYPGGAATEGLPAGVVVSDLKSFLRTDAGRIEPYLARVADPHKNMFTAWNTAFIGDGAVVFVPRGVAVALPIYLNFIASASDRALVSHPRVLIVAEPGSRVTVVETYAGSHHGTHLTNGVTEVVVGEGAAVDHIKVQCEGTESFHIATVHAVQKRHASWRSTSLSVGGALVRNDIHAVLEEEGAEAVLNGLYVAEGRQRVDHHTVIDHAAAHGSSRELYKGILGQESRGVFDGRIVVRPGARKTDAVQTNKNLLLSDRALIHTKPQLEIFADDVKCKHGATIGQLDADAMFYLRSRGIGAEEARSLLIYAFADEMIRTVGVEPIRAYFEQFVRDLSSGPER